jgi:hypothetical protein
MAFVAIFNLSGFINVLILYTTRPDIILLLQTEENDRNDDGTDVNGFFQLASRL